MRTQALLHQPQEQAQSSTLTACFSRFAPTLASTQYGNEIWSLYERAWLRPEVPLSGRFAGSTRPPDVAGVMQEISAVRAEHEARQRHKALVGK